MLTERAITRARVKTEINDCEDIRILAWWVRGRASAGAKFTALVTDR